MSIATSTNARRVRLWQWHRPHFVVFPEDEAGFAIDDQFFVGSSGLLVKPVTEKGVKETTVYLPEDQVRFIFLPRHHF